jgi:hypothetical protein
MFYIVIEMENQGIEDQVLQIHKLQYPPKRSRGRPKKIVDLSTQKRPRGRPRKYASIEEAQEAEIQYAKEYHQKVTKVMKHCSLCDIDTHYYDHHVKTKWHQLKFQLYEFQKYYLESNTGF